MQSARNRKQPRTSETHEHPRCSVRNAHFLTSSYTKNKQCFERQAYFQASQAHKIKDLSSEMLKITQRSLAVAAISFNRLSACFGMRPAADRPWSEKCLKSASNGREIIRIWNGLPEAEIPRTVSNDLPTHGLCLLIKIR